MGKGVMKAKKVSKIAKGKRARVQVFNGSKEKTATGLRKDGLVKNKRGKIVSKKASRWQEEIRGHQGLGRLRRRGAEGSEPQGLRGDQWQEGRGQGPLRQGEGPVRGAPVSSFRIAN